MRPPPSIAGTARAANGRETVTSSPRNTAASRASTAWVPPESSGSRRRTDLDATRAHPASIHVHSRSEPDMPPHRPASRYGHVVSRLALSATYTSE